MNMHVVNNETTVIKNTGKVNMCYTCLKLNMTFQHYQQTFHIQVLKVFFLFALNVQTPEATKLNSAASLIFCMLYLTSNNLSQRDKDIVS